MTTPHSVSIIIPCFERTDELERLLNSLKNLDFGEPYEVLVVDDGSKEPIKIKDCIRLEKNAGPARARNIGVAKSDGKLLWFLDSDVEITDPSLLTRMVKILEQDESLAGVGGEMIEVRGKPYSLVPYHFPNWLSFSKYISGPFAAYPKCIATNNLLIRKKDFVGFSEEFETMEDNDLCLRMRGKFLIRNDTCVLHHHSATGRNEGEFAFYNNPGDYINTVHQNRIKILYRNKKYLIPVLPLIDIIFAPPTLLCQMFSQKSSNIILEEKSKIRIGWTYFILLHIKSIIYAWKKGYELLAHSN